MFNSETNKTNLIDPYTLALIRENIAYFMLLIINIILFIGIKNIFYEKINQKKKTIELTKTEIQKLTHTKRILDSVSIPTTKIDELYEIANLVLPNKENIFSIIASLEKLAKETNFSISTYSISPINEDNQTTEITIESLSDEKLFLEFLKKYHFAGGRLKTIPKVEYKKGQKGVVIKLVFHTKKVENKTEEITTIIPSEKDIKILEQIANKVYIDIDPEILEKEYKYSTKKTLF